MSAEELTAEQQEEKDVLLSIYDGDPCFTVVADNHYQYKFESADPVKAILLDIRWSPAYPAEAPKIALDPFFNRHIVAASKESLVAAVAKEAENWLGSPMTFTLFQFVKDNQADLTADFEALPGPGSGAVEQANRAAQQSSQAAAPAAAKPEQLTKSQKRKLFDRMDNKGEMRRGWDWVDVIRHLSQTGGQND